MKEVRLTDLDELALTVRDRTARSYILEAIDAYRGGAYRSSIISTWIAVNFDIISKIRELSDQGDNNAQKVIQNLDHAINTKNIKELQKIEEELLKKASIEFEFLADQEHSDLVRLKEDRNLCAHPAYVTEEVLFEPEPERVRMHIVHAVKHLLQHQPVQGKSAIERIVRDIKRSSFPATLDTACLFLNTRYLDRAKKALVENLVKKLLPPLLRGDDPDLPLTYAQSMILTLQVISQRYPDIYEESLKVKLLRLLPSLEENQLPNIFRLLGADPRCWRWLDEPTKIHLKSVIQSSANQPDVRNLMFKATVIDELKPILIEAFNRLTPQLQISVITNTPQPEFADRAIALYSDAGSFREAESLGKSLILPMISYFSVTDIQKILKVVQQNYQIWMASGTPAILEELYDGNKQPLLHLRESWISLFEFLIPEFLIPYEYRLWSETAWKGLAKRLETAGISLPSISKVKEDED